MIKITTKETIREYDKDGKLIKETITETVEDDDTVYYPQYPVYPNQPSAPNPWWSVEPYVTCNTTGKNEVKE